MKETMQEGAVYRRGGAAVLDLAYVACGRFDGFWEEKLKIWDVAAGALMVKEAGGWAQDWSRGQDYLETGNILAGNPKIWSKLQSRLNA